MNTAARKSPRAVRTLLLLRGLPTLANRVDRPISRRDFQTLHCLPTLAPTQFPPRLNDLALIYRENRLLAFCFTVPCLT